MSTFKNVRLFAAHADEQNNSNTVRRRANKWPRASTHLILEFLKRHSVCVGDVSVACSCRAASPGWPYAVRLVAVFLQKVEVSYFSNSNLPQIDTILHIVGILSF